MPSKSKSRSPSKKLEPIDPSVSQLHFAQLEEASRQGADTIPKPKPSPRGEATTDSTGSRVLQPIVGGAGRGGGMATSGGSGSPQGYSSARGHPNSLLPGAEGASSEQTTGSSGPPVPPPPGQGRSASSSSGHNIAGSSRVVAAAVSSGPSGTTSLPGGGSELTRLTTSPPRGALPTASGSGMPESHRESNARREDNKKTEMTSLGGGITLIASSSDEGTSLPPIRSSSRSPQRPNA